MTLHFFSALALVAFLGGCAAKKPAELVEPDRLGDVGIHAIEAAPGDRYPVRTDERYLLPKAWDNNHFPLYPESLLAQRLPPVRVKVRMIVDAGGLVQQLTLLDVPGQNDPAYFAAVKAAIEHWTFSPLIRQKPAHGKTTTLKYHGITHQVTGDATALPFHQDYEFTFTQRDGRGFVSTQAPE